MLISGLSGLKVDGDDASVMETLDGEVTAVDRWSVLVVESDEAIRAALVEGLRDSGLVVDSADAASASIDAWRGDVIVTDTFARPYNSDALVAYLNDLRSRSAAGLVVLTGHNGAASDAAHLPADAVVLKPFDLEELIGVIATVAREKRSRDGSRPDFPVAS